MKELDRRIEEALRGEDAELLPAQAEEPSMLEIILETFRGRHRWLTFLGFFYTLVFMVLFVVSAIRFFRAEDTRGLLLWASASLICLICVALFKIWFWMELNKNAVTREIKRLELQVARLATRITE